MARSVGKAKAAKDRVKDILRITVAEPVMNGVLRIAWNDG
jgi:hypothetical protein